MPGIHGLVSAFGARGAVLPAPGRRALLLAASLFGFLVAAWLAAGPAWADERTADAADAVSAAEQVPEAVPGLSDGGPAEADRPDTAPGGTERTDADRGGAAAPTHATVGLDEPLTGTVTAVGENTRRVLDRSTEGLTGSVPEDEADIARRVGDTVHGVTAPVEDYLAPVPAIARGIQEPSGTEPEPESAGDSSSAKPALPEPAAPVRDAVMTSAPVPAGTGADAGHAIAPSGEPAAAHTAADAAPHPGVNSPTGATAQGCPTGGGAVAGFLSTTGAPAPAPGRLQAARHVLLSVPAESADEPIFSPD